MNCSEARKKLGIARGVLESVRQEIEGVADEFAKGEIRDTLGYVIAEIEAGLTESAMPHVECSETPVVVDPPASEWRIARAIARKVTGDTSSVVAMQKRTDAELDADPFVRWVAALLTGQVAHLRAEIADKAEGLRLAAADLEKGNAELLKAFARRNELANALDEILKVCASDSCGPLGHIESIAKAALTGSTEQ